MILEALAQQLAARTLLVPSLNGGASYHGQNGVLQRSSGKMLLLSEQSLYVGGGAFTVAAETMRIPMLNILTPLTDAWFEPLVAQQRVDATRFLARATENDILLEVATLQLELIRHFTLLETHRLSESQAFEIVQAIRGYAITGEGRVADFERAKAEWKYRRADVLDAEQGVGIATARLAQRLNLNPSVRLHPAGGPLVPLELVALDTPREQLILTALQQRPELAARAAEVRQAQLRVKQEIGRPLLPTLWLGYSAGAFGGGSNLSPPLLARFGGRTDFDVRLYWTLLNFGAGNAALIRDRQAEAGQAIATQVRTINRVRSEVIAALADAKSQRNQIEVARRELSVVACRLPRGSDPQPCQPGPADRGDQQPEPNGRGPGQPDRCGGTVRSGAIPALGRPGFPTPPGRDILPRPTARPGLSDSLTEPVSPCASNAISEAVWKDIFVP